MAWNAFGPPNAACPPVGEDILLRGGAGKVLVLDMGREVLGRIFVEFDGPPGAVVDVGFSEDMVEGRPRVVHGGPVWAAERYVSSGGPQRFEAFKPRGVRYMQINVTRSGEGVRIKRVGVVEQVYPFEKVGRFECSDSLLNDIWQLGWRTLRQCSEDAYTDCPWRERVLYGGDMLVEFALTLATSGDARLARRCIKLFAESHNPSTGGMGFRAPCPDDERGSGLHDYPVLVLATLAWYVDWSRDLAFARKVYPAFRRLMEGLLARRQPDGLFAGLRPFIDWIPMDKSGYNAAMHAAIGKGFSSLSVLARKIRRNADADRYRALAADVARTVRRRFWDSEAGAYRDGISEDGRPMRSHLPASSAWPSVFGMTTGRQERAIRKHYSKTFARCGRRAEVMATSPYGAFYILGAMYHQGWAGQAETLIREGWGRMIQAGTDTAWESFSPEPSFCHAWSGGPTYHLSTNVLGVPMGFPEPPASDALVIEPQGETIDWARGVVPHPAGGIEVGWSVEGKRLVFCCNAPRGVRWRVAPRGRLARKELVITSDHGQDRPGDAARSS